MLETVIKQEIMHYFKNAGYRVEEEFPLGVSSLYADIVVFRDESPEWIIECKADVGSSELIKGIGQCLQYNHYKNEIFPNHEKIKIGLAIPEESLRYLANLFIPNFIHLFILSYTSKGYVIKSITPDSISDLNKDEKELILHGVKFNEGINSIERLIKILNVIKETEDTEHYTEEYKKAIVKKLISEVKKSDNTSFNEKHIRINFLLTLFSYNLVDYNYRLTEISKRLLHFWELNEKETVNQIVFEIFKDPITIIFYAIIYYFKEQGKNIFDANRINSEEIVNQIRKMYQHNSYLSSKNNFVGIKYLNNYQRIPNFLGLMEDLKIIKRESGNRKIRITLEENPFIPIA